MDYESLTKWINKGLKIVDQPHNFKDLFLMKVRVRVSFSLVETFPI